VIHSADDLSAAEFAALVGSLTEGEMRMMLTYIGGRHPEAFDYALDKVRPSEPGD
jgi:hypothetical protein